MFDGITFSTTVLSGAAVGLLVSLINVLVIDWNQARKVKQRKRAAEIALIEELRHNFIRTQEAFTSGQRKGTTPQHLFGGPIESLQDRLYRQALELGLEVDWPTEVLNKVSNAYRVIQSIIQQRASGKAVVVRINGSAEIVVLEDINIRAYAPIADGHHLLVFINDAVTSLLRHLGKDRPEEL